MYTLNVCTGILVTGRGLDISVFARLLTLRRPGPDCPGIRGIRGVEGPELTARQLRIPVTGRKLIGLAVKLKRHGDLWLGILD